MENKRLFKRDYFTMLGALEEVQSNPVLRGFIDHELELLENKALRRASGDTKPSKGVIENVEVRKTILGALTTEGQRIQTIAETIGEPRAKVASLLALMHRDGIVNKFYDKKVVFFTLPIEGEEGGE